SRSPVGLGILMRNQSVEYSDDFAANVVYRVVRNDEDKVIAADMPDKSILAANSLDHVVQDHRENPDDAVTLIVAVSIVEFLEVIQVGVTDGERLRRCQPRLDLGLDCSGPGQSCRWMNTKVAIRATENRVHATANDIGA